MMGYVAPQPHLLRRYRTPVSGPVEGRARAGKARVVYNRNQIGQFEALISPHLDAAYNLARWLVRNDQDAEDMVQEACLRALKFFSGFRGADSRPGCSMPT